MARNVTPQDQYHIENCARFCVEVEKLIADSNAKAEEREQATGRPSVRLGYIDAVLAVAEKRNIDPEFAAEYINPSIREQIRIEAESKHSIPKSAKLPF